MLVDAPGVLGWTRWTEIGNRYNIGMVRDLLTNAIETGRYDPSLPLAFGLARLLGVTIEQIFEPDAAP